jgi:hypothetical protein
VPQILRRLGEHLPERRHVDGHAVEPLQQVRAELPLLAQLLQILVRREEEPPQQRAGPRLT